jgi:hypothetical protein
MAKVIGNDIVRIFSDFALGQQPDRTNDQSRADHPERDATDRL